MKQVTICSPDINTSFSHGLPFWPWHDILQCNGITFLLGKIHFMEISQAVFALKILSNQLVSAKC